MILICNLKSQVVNICHHILGPIPKAYRHDVETHMFLSSVVLKGFVPFFISSVEFLW